MSVFSDVLEALYCVQMEPGDKGELVLRIGGADRHSLLINEEYSKGYMAGYGTDGYTICGKRMWADYNCLEGQWEWMIVEPAKVY